MTIFAITWVVLATRSLLSNQTHCLTFFLSARAPHESVNVRLSMQGPNGKQLEQALHQQIQSKDTRILEEAIAHGQMDIEDVATGSVVIQLRPVTDQAVQILLNARENNRLVEMVLGMLKRVNAPDMMQGTESLEVRVQVSYASSAAAKSCKLIFTCYMHCKGI